MGTLLASPWTPIIPLPIATLQPSHPVNNSHIFSGLMLRGSGLSKLIFDNALRVRWSTISSDGRPSTVDVRRACAELARIVGDVPYESAGERAEREVAALKAEKAAILLAQAQVGQRLVADGNSAIAFAAGEALMAGQSAIAKFLRTMESKKREVLHIISEAGFPRAATTGSRSRSPTSRRPSHRSSASRSCHRASSRR
jgi:hypothetical protein